MNSKRWIGVGLALLGLIVIIFVYRETRPWWEKEGLVLSHTSTLEGSGFVAYLKNYGPVPGSLSMTEVVIHYPDGSNWEVMRFRDIGYNEQIVDGIFTFTAAIYLIDDRGWVIVDPVNRTVSYQDEMPQ